MSDIFLILETGRYCSYLMTAKPPFRGTNYLAKVLHAKKIINVLLPPRDLERETRISCTYFVRSKKKKGTDSKKKGEDDKCLCFHSCGHEEIGITSMIYGCFPSSTRLRQFKLRKLTDFL